MEFSKQQFGPKEVCDSESRFFFYNFPHCKCIKNVF